MQNSKSMKPKSIHIQVSENGKVTANVRIPFFLFKMGLKFGQGAIHSKQKDDCQNELARLKDIDMDAILEEISNGEISLPCVLVDVDEAAKNEHVTITIE